MGLVAHAALALALGAALVGADVRYAVRYAPGIFEQVAERRGIEPVSCMVAHPTEPIGTWLIVEGVRTGVRLRCRVLDVSAPADRARHIRLKRIEVDPASGAKLCGAQWHGKASECMVRVR